MGRLSDWDEGNWAGTARAVARKIGDDQIPGRAAQMSFYFFLSVFPMLLILMAVLGLFLDAQWLVRGAILDRLASVAPNSIVQVFTRLLDHLAGQSGGALTWGILVALWAASSGMVATIRGLNKIYAVAEERPWWKRRLVGLALTLILMLLTAVAMLLLGYGVPLGEAFAQRMGLGPAFVLAWQIGQWPVIFGFVLLALDLLYYFGPHRPRAHWRWLRPGTLIAIALWLAASLALKFYVTNVGHYNVAYGSLGAVIVLQLWFYLTGIAILAGAEINAQIENVKTGWVIGDQCHNGTGTADHTGSTTTIFFALGANAVIALAKIVAAVITGSGSMAAEAVHSVADCGNQGLLLLGLKSSARPPDAEHPLGYGRAIYFWSFIVALMLFSMGGLFSIYESIHKIGSNEPLRDPWIAIGVLLFSIAAEGVALWKCLTQIDALRGEQSLWRWFRTTRHSELLVVLGEDVAATLGLSFALVAIAAAMLTGNPFYDALGSMAIGVLLLVVAVFVGIEVKSLLVGQSADPAVQEEIGRFLTGREEIADLLNVITLQHGADVVVAVKARMTESASAIAMVEAINSCERALRAAFPQVRWLFFEPEVRK